MSDDLVLDFDPLDYEIHVQVAPAPLRTGEPDDFIGHYAAQLLPAEDLREGGPVVFPEDKRAIASLTWQHLEFGAARDEGHHPLADVADAYGGDIFHVASILLDEETGEPRDELELGIAGSDLLYLETLWVDPKFDLVEVGREIVEYVLRHHGAGCYAAAYYRDQVHRLDVSRLLLDRGFVHLKEKGLFVVDLARARPPLPGEPDSRLD